MEKEKILLDTDIGSDIDDALCLMFLLAEPRCELMGITTVTGKPEKRAMLAQSLCMYAHKDITVKAGAAAPLLGLQKQTEVPLAETMTEWSYTDPSPQESAVRFMQRIVRENPHEITLLSIGPLTNIALLFALDPQIPSLLKQLVMMCGVFHHTLPGLENFHCEWNAQVDPYATALVYKSLPRVHRSVGMDVTCQVVMNREQALASFDKDLLKPVVSLERWFASHPCITFHDPLAGVSIFHEDVCTFEAGHVEVVLDNEEFRGKTLWVPGGGDGIHEVASAVDSTRFFRYYFSTLHSANSCGLRSFTAS